jgi:hypothetical protein
MCRFFSAAINQWFIYSAMRDVWAMDWWEFATGGEGPNWYRQLIYNDLQMTSAQYFIINEFTHIHSEAAAAASAANTNRERWWWICAGGWFALRVNKHAMRRAVFAFMAQ